MLSEAERKRILKRNARRDSFGPSVRIDHQFFRSFRMNRFYKIATGAAAALAAQAALANPLGPNAVPEPGALGLVGVALAAAIYFGKRRK